MQSFRGSIQLIRRQTHTTLNNGHFESIRVLALSGGSGFSSSAAPTSSNGSVTSQLVGNPFGSLKGLFSGSFSRMCNQSQMEFTSLGTETELRSSNSISKEFKSPRPHFLCRGFATSADSMPSASQDSAPTDSDLAPRIKFKRLDKTAKHIMQILDKEAVEEVKAQREMPDIKPGYIVQLKVEVPENKRRVSILKGIVIARRNAGLNTTFRLRRLVAGVGVESLFPLYSPNIKEIKVLDKKKVRRAKLYYLRDKMNALKKH